MQTLYQDIRYGVRMLLKKPAFSTVSVLILGIGIGANTGIFSVVSSVLLRPLPYAHPERLVRLMSIDTKRGTTGTNLSFPNFVDMRGSNDTFDALAAYNDSTAALTGGDTAERIDIVEAAADFFSVLDVQPLVGRGFTLEDEQPGTTSVVITHGMWQRRFGGDPDILGRSITLSGKQKYIVGVLPPDFRFVFINTSPEVFVPLNVKGSMEVQRGAGVYDVIGRLKPGVSLARAEAQLRSIAARLEEQYPEEDSGESVGVVSAQESLVKDVRTTLLLLLGTVGFVLLIACANVANLQLARATSRAREIAIRVALGASRWRIVRQLLTENLLLSVLGASMGLLLALWGLDLVSGFIPPDIPRIGDTGADWRVLAFTLAAAVLTGIGFGLAPALQASRTNLNECLKEGGRSATDSSGRQLVRSSLIVVEVALSLVLLAGAGLLIKSFMRLRSTDVGFEPERVLSASISLPTTKYPEDEQIVNFYRQLLDRASQIPGVDSAGAIMPLPLSENSISTSFSVEAQPDPGPGARPIAHARIITPDYLRSMGIPMISGRPFSERDSADAPKVILINRSFADKYFASEDPVGKRLQLGLNSIDGQIIGVVGDVRHKSLDVEAGPEYYVPHSQIGNSTMSIVLRTTTGDPAALAAPFRDLVREMDKDLPVYRIRPASQLVASSVSRQQFSMTLVAGFAMLALALACAGLFSVMSFLVAQRTHEIGIRMAIGAPTRRIRWMVVSQGLKLSVIGVAVGLALAYSLMHFMSTLLYRVTATDPTIFFGTAAALLLVSIVACDAPARRATRVDPLVALRYE